MRNRSQKTRIGIIREHVAAWRKANGWSRESAAAEIVAAHERIGADVLTGIVFERHPDTYTTQKNHADRIWRWLDDESKDSNLLPSNFENSILAALPLERRVDLLNEVLAQVDCAARARHADADAELDVTDLMRTIMRTNHRTESDAADLLDGVDPGELPRLHGSLVEDIHAKQRSLRIVETAMARSGEGVPAHLKKVAG